MVQRMLYEFEWDIALAIESAQADALSVAMSPRLLAAKQLAAELKARLSDGLASMSDRLSGASSRLSSRVSSRSSSRRSEGGSRLSIYSRRKSSVAPGDQTVRDTPAASNLMLALPARVGRRARSVVER